MVVAVLSNLGTNAQKQAHMDNEERPLDEQRHYTRLPFWWLGFLGVLSGAIGDFVALGLASQSLVAALGGGTTLVSNVIIAHIWNKDEFFRTDAIGTFFIILGAVWFAVFTVDAPDESLEELKQHMYRPWFIIYISVQLVILLGLLSTIVTSACYEMRKDMTFAILQPMVYRLEEAEDRMERLECHIKSLEAKINPTLPGGGREYGRRWSTKERDYLKVTEIPLSSSLT